MSSRFASASVGHLDAAEAIAHVVFYAKDALEVHIPF